MLQPEKDGAEPSPSAATDLPRVPALKEEWVMKYAGLLVMPAGFFLAIAAIVLFPDPTPRIGFLLCSLAVEAMGLGVAVRGHMEPRGERRS